jgi:hypothetical protein
VRRNLDTKRTAASRRNANSDAVDAKRHQYRRFAVSHQPSLRFVEPFNFAPGRLVKPCPSLSRSRRGNGHLRGQGMANLPVEAERVDQASQSPAVLLAYREHLGRAGCQGLRENCIRVADGQNHSDRPAPERLPA